MEIVKRLSLNRTPKDIPNNSIVCAKNMMIDDTGSFLTQDTAIQKVWECEYGDIVGIIPCNDELVIFTAVPNREGSTTTWSNSKVWRKRDNSSTPVDVICDWKYSGGVINGGCTYNYKNELIVVVAESGASKDVPLKSFIIHDDSGQWKAEFNQTYATEELIPPYDCSYSITDKGNLVCGTYTFFIRFKVDTDNYTKWFQVSTDIHIIQPIETKGYIHRYLNKDDGLATPVSADPLIVNSNGISAKAINLSLKFTNSHFTKFQLGYIIQRNDDVQGRIQGLYTLEDEINIVISNNSYTEDISIDSLLENPHSFYNVDTVSLYNNRLYIANYKEYNVADYSNYAKNINIISASDDIEDEQQAPLSPGYVCKDVSFKVVQDYRTENVSRWYRHTDTKTISLRQLVVSDEGQVVRKNKVTDRLYDTIYLFDGFTGWKYFVNGNIDTYASYLPNGSKDINLYLFVQKAANDAVCIEQHITDDTFNPSTHGWNWDFTKQSFDVYVGDDNIYLKINGSDYYIAGQPPQGETLSHFVILGYSYSDIFDESTFIVGCNSYTGGGNIPASANINKPNILQPFATTTLNSIETVSSSEQEIEDDDSYAGGITINGKDANSRTLIPHQYYNFFIHYVRPDGSCTPGYSIGTAKFTTVSGRIIIPKFTNVTKPVGEDFVGFFISYEDVERNVDCVYIEDDDGNSKFVKITNAEWMYDLDNIGGIKLTIGSSHDGTSYPLSSLILTYVRNQLINNHIKIDNSVLAIQESDVIGFLIKVVNDAFNKPYNNEYKTLFRLTKNIYTFTGLNVDGFADNDYLPDYYNNQILIRYSGADGFIIDPAATHVLGFEGDAINKKGTPTTYDVEENIIKLYSKYPTEAMSIKQDFLTVANVLSYKETPSSEELTSELYVNVVMPPDRLHDFLELKPAYRAKPLKVYTNYREDNISRFDKTIYRSDVVSDESLVNGFRHFEPNNYKNILENKGKITNIIGIGLYLLVHTEYSLFMFDRSPKLTAKLQSDIPDTFDIDYQEVMPSNQGFGGLQDKKESIVTKNGYVWFDKTNKYIFNFVDGKTEIISRDIHNFIKLLSISKVRFAEDVIHNRLIVCFTLDSDYYITLSYNFNTKTFISAHDYQFTDNYRTYKKSYLVYRDSTDSKGINNCLYEYTNNHTATYSGLYDINNVCIPTYAKDANSSKSFIDIIYNIAPENSKTLISLSYVLNEILLEIYDANQAEGKHKNPSKINERGEPSYRYSGDELLLYTDETNTGLLDIHVKDNEFNKYAEYRYPIFNKGIWELNYFRNIITTPTQYEEEVQAALELTKPPVLESDPRSLIYGKYIVARFIFNNNTKVKLDNITFNTEAY